MQAKVLTKYEARQIAVNVASVRGDRYSLTD